MNVSIRFLVFPAVAAILPCLADAVCHAAPSRLPPLEPFFAEPARFAECLSPNGKLVAYLGPDDAGVNSLWTVETDNPGKPSRISAVDGPAVTAFFWLGDGSILWQVIRSNGSLRFFLGQPRHGAAAREILAGEKRIVSLAGVVDSADPCLLVGLADSPTAFPDLFRVRLDGNDRPEPVCANRHRIIAWAWDATGAPVAGLRWTDGGAKEILDLRNDGGTVVFRAEAGDDARLLFASTDGSHAFVLTNRGSDLTRLVSLDLTTGGSATLASDPLGKVDVEQVVTDFGGNTILAAGYRDERIRWQALDPAFTKLLDVLEKIPQSRCMTVLGMDVTREHCLLKRLSKRDPGTVDVIDLESGILRMLWRVCPDLDPDSLCETESLDYPARDGCRIPAFLTVPRNSEPPWPLVVFPHGGPRMRTNPGLDGRVQFLASRGYAVLQPDFRGSRGYGKAFMNAGDGQWGKGLMQTDVTDGVEHLVGIGLADRARVAIMGGSYGGYAALAGLAFTPDLYAAGVCLFGISDLSAYAAFCPTEWQPFAGDTVRRLGDPSTAAGRSVLADLSPVNHAALVRAPLLIYHGLNDNLIPVGHTRRMVAALKQAGKPVTCLLAPDEAHGFMRQESEMAVYRAIEVFLHTHIGGLVGPAPTGQVSRRLAWFRESGLPQLGLSDRQCLPPCRNPGSSTAYPQPTIP